MIVFGEDVGRKGGVYGVTRGLRSAFGPARVFDSLLDEQTILGVALGAGRPGCCRSRDPVPGLRAQRRRPDPRRGRDAARSSPRGQYRNPMVVRVAGLAYQKGFGGHFHNDNSVAALRDIPGIVIACPARPDDAAAMLRTCLAAAEVDGSVCVFLEPIALYHERDLYEPGDGGWLARYEPPDRGRTRTCQSAAAAHLRRGSDLTIITFGNGLRMSLRAARTLAAEGVRCRVLDLRWLAPLPYEDLLRAAGATGRVLVADETRRTGGVSEGVVPTLGRRGFTGRDRAGGQRGQLHAARRRHRGRAAVGAAMRGRARDLLPVTARWSGQLEDRPDTLAPGPCPAGRNAIRSGCPAVSPAGVSVGQLRPPPRALVELGDGQDGRAGARRAARVHGPAHQRRAAAAGTQSSSARPQVVHCAACGSL